MLTIYLWSFIIWLFILLIGVILRKKWIGKNLMRFSYVVLLLFLIEGTCLLALRVKTGIWLFREKYNQNAELFEPHPYLVGVPKKNVHLVIDGISYSHNSQGNRGKEFDLRKSCTRIIAIGGSTTYGTSVSDWQTWPYFLDSMLNDKAEVLNFGIAGHSSVEHIIQSALIIPEYNPDMVLIHCGLNDLRSLYIDSLAADYHDFHAPNLYGALGFCYLNKLPRLAIIRVGVILLQRMKFYPECAYYKVHVRESISAENLQRALNLYKRNLFTLATMYKSRGTQLVFIPQLLNHKAFEGNKLRWWIPFIPDEQLEGIVAKYNQCMQEVADSMQADFVANIIINDWAGSDFVDPSHLNPEANLRFAQFIKDEIIQVMETEH